MKLLATAVLLLAAGCSLHTPPVDAPYRFRCESGNDCVEGYYCVAGYCTEGLMSAGSRHTCMLRSDGTAACWGAGTADAGEGVHRGQSDPLPDRFVDIAAGGFHTCGLKPNGRVKCWGSDHDGQSSPPDVRFRQITAGHRHSCGVTADGHIRCWGAGETADGCTVNDRMDCGQAMVPEYATIRDYQDVAAGGYHTCARTDMRTVDCWGAGTADATGPGPHYDQAHTPEVMRFVDTVTQLSSGMYHTCAAVTRTFIDDVRIGCWGAGLPSISTWPHFGQSTPVGGDYVRVATGGMHTCGLDIDAEIACWGAGTGASSTAECVLDATDCGQARPPVTTGIRFITAGFAHTCAIETDGAVACWGAGQTVGECNEYRYECGQSIPSSDLY